MPTMTPSSRLEALRQIMEREGLHALVVPTADPHQSEYVPACWKRREWISGFTGSAGTAVIERKTASLLTDSRYFLQAEKEMDPACWQLVRLGTAEAAGLPEWLEARLAAGQVVGLDPETMSVESERRLRASVERAGAKLVPVADNPVDRIWSDRPGRSTAPVESLPETFAGETVASKLSRVRDAVAKAGAECHVITMLDAVAWLFNLRGADVEFNPVFVAHALVEPSRATLFLDAAKLCQSTHATLPADVAVAPYEAFTQALDDRGRDKSVVLVDPATCSAAVLARLSQAGARLREARSPVTTFKAAKNPVELAGARSAHQRDGVAMVRFLAWLDDAVPKGGVTEVSAADALEELRGEGAHFRGLSFPSISAWADHGAIVHYRPSRSADRPLGPAGMYLIDSGAQYLDGTTDITRTIAFGEPAPSWRDHYTRVLRGHASLALAVFPEGTNGAHLDAFARRALWEAGLDYGHGTGHGVGAYLNVHEGPQSISRKGTDAALAAGMICSNEPGVYLPGQHGVRLENLVVVVPREDLSSSGTRFLGFETITACPFDRRLIDASALLPEERRWVDRYHAWVRDSLSPDLDVGTRAWLSRATAPL